MVNTRESVDGSWRHRDSINSLALGKVEEVDCEKGMFQIRPCPKFHRQSIMSDVSGRDNSISDIDEGACMERCQRRVHTLLHTHVCLLFVCLFAISDAGCVVGQLICDILIMKEKLQYAETNDDLLTEELFKYIPHLNRTLHPKWNLDAILETLKGTDIHVPMLGPLPTPPAWMAANLSAMIPVAVPRLLSENASNVIGTVGGALIRHRRALAPRVPGHEVDHGTLYTITHTCHIGSLVILSLLLVETMCKIFAMGTKLKNHKLEVFDGVVVVVSWVLDLVFWEGIWAHPGTTSASILIYLLPWRVVRIVNSFVLVIQEKDHVQLKIVKQRLRASQKRSKAGDDKRYMLSHEVKNLAGLCRLHGIKEEEIVRCSPSANSQKRRSSIQMMLNPKELIKTLGTSRRRSSLHSAIERTASLAMISACASLGSNPSLVGLDLMAEDDLIVESEFGFRHKTLEATSSAAPTMKSALSSTTLDSNSVVDTAEKHEHHDSGLDTAMHSEHSDCGSSSSKDDGGKRTVVWTCSNDSEPPTYKNVTEDANVIEENVNEEIVIEEIVIEENVIGGNVNDAYVTDSEEIEVVVSPTTDNTRL